MDLAMYLINERSAEKNDVLPNYGSTTKKGCSCQTLVSSEVSGCSADVGSVGRVGVKWEKWVT